MLLSFYLLPSGPTLYSLKFTFVPGGYAFERRLQYQFNWRIVFFFCFSFCGITVKHSITMYGQHSLKFNFS